MNYLFESIIVGAYSSIVYLITKNFVNNVYLLFFLIGFIKHLLGYLLNIHTFYCNYGYACSNKNKNKVAIYTNYLFAESVIEGILYLSFGLLFNKIIKNKLIDIFIVGVLLHIISEKLKIHIFFCKNRCVTSIE
jgi:hypothetical protein